MSLHALYTMLCNMKACGQRRWTHEGEEMNYTWSIIELENELRMESFLPSGDSGKAPLVFVHGNFCGSWCYHNFARYFAGRGIPCHLVNFRGHWLSGGHGELGKAVTEDYVADVETCIESIGQRVVLVGHSMGGVVSQKVAERGDLEALVLLDSGPCKYLTENFFRPDPQIMPVLQAVFKPQVDGTVRLDPQVDKLKQIFFEKDNVSNEMLIQTVSYLGRESAKALQKHPLLPVDPSKITCDVYVIGRRGSGNEKNPDLWDAMADYFDAKGRHISSEISHNMFAENNWVEHAERIESWCR
jgi:pimeloyl-ACP methyl ester carboxylesterase